MRKQFNTGRSVLENTDWENSKVSHSLMRRHQKEACEIVVLLILTLISFALVNTDIWNN